MMTKKKYHLLFLLFCVFLQNCSSTLEKKQKTDAPKNAQVTDNGIKYMFYLKNEKGKKAVKGTYITYHKVIQNSKDSTLRNTYNEITGAILQEPFEKMGLPVEALELLSEGDSVSFWVNVEWMSTKKNTPRPDYFEPNSDIKYTLKILKVQDEEEIKKELQKQLGLQKEKDIKIIEEFISAIPEYKGIKKTDSGLYYQIRLEGKGKKPDKGDTVAVHYTGKFLNGKIFDSSKGDQPIEFPIGRNVVMEGWDEGIALFNQGTKGTLIIPSYLAFGREGMGKSIPPNSILIYELELVEVK